MFSKLDRLREFRAHCSLLVLMHCYCIIVVLLPVELSTVCTLMHRQYVCTSSLNSLGSLSMGTCTTNIPAGETVSFVSNAHVLVKSASRECSFQIFQTVIIVRKLSYLDEVMVTISKSKLKKRSPWLALVKCLLIITSVMGVLGNLWLLKENDNSNLNEAGKETYVLQVESDSQSATEAELEQQELQQEIKKQTNLKKTLSYVQDILSEHQSRAGHNEMIQEGSITDEGAQGQLTKPGATSYASLSNDEDVENIVNVFRDAGVELDEDTLRTLPSWSTIVSNIGIAPKIYGLDSCTRFREQIPALERNVGSCGMFNSGTNLVTRLLKENCIIPERVDFYGWEDTFDKWQMGPHDAHGMRWQVPWGKHTAARYRNLHSTKHAVDVEKDSLLPVVTIRHPYAWMKSMCHNSYTAKWAHSSKSCPHLLTDESSMTPTSLTVKYGDHEDAFDSLAHLWNGWYNQYRKEASYPFVMIRFEDLIFHTKNVTTQICHCAGGEIRSDRPFFYIVESAKQGPGHGKDRTGMVQAWIKYGNPMTPRADFSASDSKAAKAFLDSDLMNIFGYKHP